MIHAINTNLYLYVCVYKKDYRGAEMEWMFSAVCKSGEEEPAERLLELFPQEISGASGDCADREKEQQRIVTQKPPNNMYKKSYMMINK